MGNYSNKNLWDSEEYSDSDERVERRAKENKDKERYLRRNQARSSKSKYTKVKPESDY